MVNVVAPGMLRSCGALAGDFLVMAQRADPIGFADARRHYGRVDITVWHYLVYKLSVGLDTWRRRGEAGWAWDIAPGRLVCGIMWCTGGQEGQACSPFTGVAGTGGDRWWPIIFKDIAGEVKPTYCPALAWQNARPWMGHTSRLWEIPNEGDFEYLPAEIPGRQPDLLMLALGPDAGPVPPPPPPPPQPVVATPTPQPARRRRWGRCDDRSSTTSASSSPATSSIGSREVAEDFDMLHEYVTTLVDTPRTNHEEDDGT
jgi:hypothetical protein